MRDQFVVKCYMIAIHFPEASLLLHSFLWIFHCFYAYTRLSIDETIRLFRVYWLHLMKMRLKSGNWFWWNEQTHFHIQQMLQSFLQLIDTILSLGHTDLSVYWLIDANHWFYLIRMNRLLKLKRNRVRKSTSVDTINSR